MYKCPNCGAELRFDIKTQKLLCDHCSTTVDPYKYEQGGEAEKAEDGTYGVNVFRCPECGGEIISTSSAAAEFCSYCGASVVLESRLSREKKPESVIPFAVTKDDCKTTYMKMMKHAIFTPKELKDEKYIDSFRGIYMPYWLYDVVNKGPVSVEGTKSHRSGDYIYTDHYDLHCDVDAEYDGIPYDASSTFDDNISEAIAPFDVTKMKEFTPAFLCGFYADTADVDSGVYEGEAADFANEQSMNEIEKHFNGYDIMGADPGANPALETQKASRISNAMFPVWFMSYRKGDRVAYATINGQTGKPCADLPVDMKKFLIGSLILTLPLFAVLALLPTVTAITTAGISSFLALVSAIMYVATMHRITARETHSDDKGYAAAEKTDAAGGAPGPEKARKKITRKVWLVLSWIMFVIVLIFVVLYEAGVSYGDGGAGAAGFFTSVNATIVIIMGFIAGKKFRKGVKAAGGKHDAGSFMSGYLGMIAAVIITAAVLIAHPVKDYYYYAAAIISLFAEGFSMLITIRKYNILATRRLPVFDRKGGDDRA
jgi:DNA-directed RNA polymerase subunit RPC12/RpoP